MQKKFDELPPKVKTYITNLNNGNIKSKSLLILDYIKKHPLTNIHHMRIELNVSHQTLTSIISNFMDYGIVRAVGEVKIPIRSRDSFFTVLEYVEDIEMIFALQRLRRMNKYLIWVNRGLTEFNSLNDEKLNRILTETQKLTSDLLGFHNYKDF